MAGDLREAHHNLMLPNLYGLQFILEEGVHIAKALIVEPRGIALQALVGLTVDDVGEGLLNRELRVVVLTLFRTHMSTDANFVRSSTI